MSLNFAFLILLFIFSNSSSALESIKIPVGRYINELPGAQLLKGTSNSTNISISLTPAELIGPNVTFRTPVYKDDTLKEAYIFGPTIRVKRGGHLEIKLTNNLVDNGPPSNLANGFHNPSSTNLHTHGLHSAAGNLDQNSAQQSTDGGDNIFVSIPSRSNDASLGTSVTFPRDLNPEHMPGLYWYHPHSHGATALQVYSANGLIIVEDDLQNWLPDSAGCGPVRDALDTSEEIILHLEMLSFKPPPGETPLTASSATNAQILATPRSKIAYTVDANVQSLSFLSEPKNPLCCDDTALQSGQGALLTGSNSGQDLLLVNGAWQPTIPMTSSVYQRWRLIFTGFKRFTDMQIIDADTKTVTKDCEMQLISKDALFLMQVPRAVEHMFLTSGNRAELLVKCTGPVGKKYIITSGNSYVVPPFENPNAMGGGGGMGGGGLGMNAELAHNQPIVAFIEITKSAENTSSSLKEKSCTPLLPTYAPDLRDASIQASNAAGKIFKAATSFQMAQGGSCTLNGAPFVYPDPNPIQLPISMIVEWNFGMLAFHPMHIHTNPYQIVSLPAAPLKPYTSWFEVGDLHDVLMVPVVSSNQAVGLRLQPGPYPGFEVLHCHLLSHEDGGCMKVTSAYCPGTKPTDKQPSTCSNIDYPVKGTFSTKQSAPVVGNSTQDVSESTVTAPKPGTDNSMNHNVNDMMTSGSLYSFLSNKYATILCFCMFFLY